MKSLSKADQYESNSGDKTTTEKMLSEQDFHDGKESREPDDFESLRKAMQIANDQPAECLELCLEQIKKTPDYDMPYLWASNFQNSNGDYEKSVSTLTKGLKSCLRVSNLLSKLGERFIDKENPVLATISFGKSIQAQEPPRSLHDSYLYFAYICIFSDYDNAGQKNLVTARKIYGEKIDLTYETQSDIKKIVSSNLQDVVPLVKYFIQVLLEEGRID